jgi:XapX domain-containing protein
MRILIAFVVAFGIGAGSRWTGVPSLAPQAIVGALLIVAMSTGWVTADRILGHGMAVFNSSEKPGIQEVRESFKRTTRDDMSAFWRNQ